MKKQTLLVAFSLVESRHKPLIFPKECENPVKQIQLLTAFENLLLGNDKADYLTPLDWFTLPAPIPAMLALHTDFDVYTYDENTDTFIETTFVNEAKKRENGQQEQCI